jgi:hypothetical protein
MGSVRFGIPRELTLSLKEKYGIPDFIETGTLEGHSSAWAAQHFKRVWTIDIFPMESSYANLRGLGNVGRFICDSGLFMESHVHSIVLHPTLFWLDAHTNEVCPVLREIKAINQSRYRRVILVDGEPSGMGSRNFAHVILVDDARLFGTLPDWPTVGQVIEELEDCGRRTTEVIEDVIVATPCP